MKPFGIRLNDKTLASLLALLLSVACSKTTTLHISCVVTDQDQHPLEGAVLKLSDNPLAYSNKKGQIDLRLKLDQERMLELTVSKEDSSVYYDSTTFHITASKSNRYETSLKATLRGVPKAFSATSSNIEKVAVATAKPVTTVYSQHLADRSPTPLSSTRVLSPSPLTFVEEKALSTDLPVTSVAKLNLYIRSHSKPQAGASIYLTNERTLIYEKVCITNERGRCQFGLPENSSAERKLLIRQPGFLSKVLVLNKLESTPLLIDLESGTSFDVFALQNSWSGQRGLSGIQLSINDRVIGKTDEHGFFSYPTGEFEEPQEVVNLKSGAHLPALISIPVDKGTPRTIIKNFVATQDPVHIVVEPLDLHSQEPTQDGRVVKARIETAIKQALENSSKERLDIVIHSEIIAASDAKKPQVPEVVQPDIKLKFAAFQQAEKQWNLTLTAQAPQLRNSTMQTQDLRDIEDALQTTETILPMVLQILSSIKPVGALTSVGNALTVVNKGSVNSGVKVGDHFEVYTFNSTMPAAVLQDLPVGQVTITSVNTLESQGNFVALNPGVIAQPGDILIYQQGELASWQPKHRLKNLKR